MKPFFGYFGAKHRAAPHYPRPAHELVIEPFAGSAGYATRWNARRALLIDRDEHVVGVWQYLIKASAAEIRALPLLEPGQRVDSLAVHQEARWLIGFWCGVGAWTPRLSGLSPWGVANLKKGLMKSWGPRVRERIASQVDRIRDWSAVLGSYRDAPDVDATWFIDPPYQVAGTKYRHGSRAVDFTDLAAFCRDRRGLVMACEANGATWLPFVPLAPVVSCAAGTGKPSDEVVWLSGRDVAWSDKVQSGFQW
jgi:hypothetical protein